MIVFCQQCNTQPLSSTAGDIRAEDFLRGFHSAQMLRPVCPVCRCFELIRANVNETWKLLFGCELF